MLTALEVVGFKSFADKTRFEFPAGITVVVGPNGSGKSNIVDAIKWVLGEQSVKSLRGKEMADVIFNGSGGRRELNSAEATLTFSNAEGLLAIDTPEVHITRRVYRSGEGEYMINRQPCRLRDIRDLFAGTGAATEAYSVIEQGKVDVLLQASPRDRRVIFEEAAGISRFKAKKLEAMRRLERVDQNLLRLSDIVEEVDSRLRSVRTQASKARRYQEHTDRLQELRTQVGLADWRALSEQLDTLESKLTTVGDETSRASAQVESGEAQILELEAAIGNVDKEVRLCEARLADNRERIATQESTIEHERGRCRDLEEEVARNRRHLAGMRTRAGNLEQQLAETSAALKEAVQQNEQTRLQLTSDKQSLGEVTAHLDRLREQTDASRDQHMDRMRTAAALGNQISVLRSQISEAQRSCQRRQQQIAELTASCQQRTAQLQELHQQQAVLTRQADTCQTELVASRSQLASGRSQLAAAQKELLQLEGRHSGALERARVLEELEKRLEGVSAGVKQVLLQVRESTGGPWSQIRGLLADLIAVKVESAPLVEVALGERAQYLVIAPGRELVDFLSDEPVRLPGRVGFLPMGGREPAAGDGRIELGGEPGVLGRADRFVEADDEYLPLVRRLLGRTWIVEKLTHALALAEGAGRGLSFVTPAGEMLSADGTLTIGPPHHSAGLISRRSELRALREAIAELEAEIAQSRAAVVAMELEVQHQQQLVETLSAQHQRAAAALAEQRLRTSAAEERLAELNEQIETYRGELTAAEAQLETTAAELAVARARLTETETELAGLESEIQQSARQLGELETERSQLSRVVTNEEVQSAKSEQRVDSLRVQMQQLERDQQERGRALAESQAQLEQCTRRVRQSEQNILRAGSEVAELYLRKERLAAEAVAHMNRREEDISRRTALAAKVQQTRQQIRKLEEVQHELNLAASDVRHQRTTLAERLREDYQIELAELEHKPSDEELHRREEVEQEIAELRRKITNIGSVNLEALVELDELEKRYGLLSAQYEDLSSAKSTLEGIIGKINADSRHLFGETLETVRGHFQVLFRKLFGGGRADIVLEEGVDILESGIEIVARPPGKEPRSISLLSGGEKTLTCVALLMAIFRSRPSPFCVLDEVDAALDEANIERFVAVIREFLAWTQFIVVTHSKKTMTCASTLYGVTMQESGVSKRVSVRFEDVSEDGQILESALEKSGGRKDQADDAEDETQAA